MHTFTYVRFRNFKHLECTISRTLTLHCVSADFIIIGHPIFIYRLIEHCSNISIDIHRPTLKTLSHLYLMLFSRFFLLNLRRGWRGAGAGEQGIHRTLQLSFLFQTSISKCRDSTENVWRWFRPFDGTILTEGTNQYITSLRVLFIRWCICELWIIGGLCGVGVGVTT